jgi:trimeric autotransporter adhesin
MYTPRTTIIAAFIVAYFLVSTEAVSGDGPCTPVFASGPHPTAGTDPRAVAIGDLNGDGRNDLVAVDFAVNKVLVFLNSSTRDGFVSFSAPVLYTAGSRPHAVVIGDVDHDGDMDLAVANHFGDSVSVLQNAGNGTFFPPINYPIGNQPRSLAMADLDGDGDLDIAAANFTYNVGVLVNNGNGTFFFHQSLPVGTAESIAIGDVNGDNKPDMVTANYGSNDV